MSGVVIIPCTVKHTHAVSQYCRGTAEHKKLHHRALSLVAWHSAANRVVGYISIDGISAAIDRAASAKRLASIDAQGLGYSSNTSAYVQYIKVDEEFHASVTLQLVQAAFSAVAQLTHLLLVSHAELQSETHAGLAAVFSKAMHSSSSGLWLYECSRNVVLPPLQVRHAKIEDHDDLLPIVAAAAAGSCPSLAALPESCKPEEPFALTRLICSQDAQNIVLVAADQGKLVGLLVVTSQLDIALLLQSFDLGPFDGLLPADVYEACEAAAQTAAAAKAEQRCQQQKQQQQQQQADGEQTDTREAAAILPTEQDVKEELLPLLLDAVSRRQVGEGNVPHNLLAITMLCMLPGYEARAVDFLPPVFQEFTGKDFFVLSLPHDAREPPLANQMSHLPPLPGGPYPEVLLLGHRAALNVQCGSWEVRLAQPDDVVGLHGLIGSLANAVEVQEAFLHALGRQGAVVATVEGEVVGMAAATPSVDLQLLQSNFKLDEVLPAGYCVTPSAHAELDVCIMNPVFSKCVGALLEGALQLLGKSYLHYALLPGQAVPEWLPIMQQQPPHHSSSSAQTAEFALYSFTKHMAYAPKQVINSQIVFVGASETTLACLEQLLLQPQLTFTSLTLLAPGGVPVGGVACQFTAGLVARIGLQAAVTIVDGQMAALDTAEKVIGLSDGSQLSYDLLVVSTGLQDQLGPAIASACPGAAQFVLSSQALIRGSISTEAAAGLSSVLMYAADLQAFDVVVALTDAGMSADAITWVCPDKEQQDPLLPLLTALAAELQLELPTPQEGQLLELVPTEDGTRAMADLQACEGGPVQQLELDLLVGCGRRGPSAAVARCLRDAGLVWDGRLVVDADYSSSNPAVLGAGPAVKFSRRYTLPEVMHEQYSSTEVGASLAAAIVRIVATPPNGTTITAGAAAATCSTAKQKQQKRGQLPKLMQGKVQGCRLPGGRVFAFAGCPAAIASPSLAPPPGGRSLISRSSGNEGSSDAAADSGTPANTAVINICLGAEDVVHHVAYLGPGATAASKLAALVGLPFSYLAAGLQLPAKQPGVSNSTATCSVASRQSDLQVDEGAGLVAGRMQQQQPSVNMKGVPSATAGPEPGTYILGQDVIAQLAQPWAALLFHESLQQMRQQLLKQCSTGLQGDEAGSIAEQVHAAVLPVLQGCVNTAGLPVLQQATAMHLHSAYTSC